MEKNFEEEFEKIYQEIYDSCNTKLKETKTRNNIFILAVLLVGIIANIIIYFCIDMKPMITGTIAITFCILLFLIIKAKEIYKKVYKNSVIEALVKSYNSKLYYDQKMGISKFDYTVSNFDNNFNEFYSEDQIYGTLENGTKVKICEIATAIIDRMKDADGNIKEERTETYRGMYGIAKLNHSISSSIYIANDSITKRYSNNRVEVDSAEFEKYYDCITQDKVKALRILNSELIEKFNEIRRNSKFGFELKIEDDSIYFRYKCGQMFEPPTFRSGLNKDLVKKYYKFIFYPFEIIQKISENIAEIAETE
jgi:hypothetical protein